MKKILTIGWKDLLVIFRDRGALVLMLAAPFVLTVGMGLITGAFSDSDTGAGLADIPLVIVNEDSGELGAALAETFASDDLANLLQPVLLDDTAEARRRVDDDEIAAAVFIPAGFTDSIIPQQETGAPGVPAAIEVYANPARPISAGVVESVVQGFVSQVETGVLSVEVAMTQLVQSGRVSLADMDALAGMGQEMGARLVVEPAAAPIEIRRETAAAGDDNFNALTYFAPAMAVAFLMYTVSLGGRSILAEREEGTLPRLLASPTSAVQVLAGKMVGIFLTGVAQVGVLILASTLLFGLRWGDPLGVLLLVLAVSAAATGWGVLLAAFARNSGQVATYGSAMMLLFAIVGGSFVPVARDTLMAQVGKITPNAWAIDGFTALGQGGTLADIGSALLGLAVMAILLFAVAVPNFRRRATA